MKKTFVEELLEDYLGVFHSNGSRALQPFPSSTGTLVRKDGDKTVIEVEMPGATKEDVELSLNDTTLVVSWKARGVENSKSFRVSKDLDPSKISAKVVNGLFTVELQRLELKTLKGVKIPIG